MGTSIVARDGTAPVSISVVIATIGRSDHLAASLAAYTGLVPETPPFEVIIVLDGWDPASAEVASRPYPFPTLVLSQPRAGIGPAKNLGARSAAGDLLLFLNDDTRPDTSCLLAHATAQERFGPCIAVGRIDWDPEHEVTPYMAWLAPAGHQFNFARLEPDGLIPWDACWGANLAVPREWLLDEPFDPLLPFPALEDGEWAYRQHRRRRPLRYVAAARVWHHHQIEGPGAFRRRARNAGATARYVSRRHPRLAFTLVARPVLAAVVASVLAAWPGRWRRTTLWDLAYRWGYVAGLIVPPSK